MAEAPQYGGPQIRTAPIATPRQDPGIATPDAFGAAAAQGLGKAAYSVATVAKEEEDKKRQDDAFALVNRAHGEVVRITAEAKQQRGKSAEGLTERTRKAFDEAKADVSKDTTDPDILDVFNRQMEMRWRDVDTVVTGHAVAELDAYKRHEYDSANVNERTAALEVDSIERIEESLLKQEATRELAGVSLGDDPDTIKLKVKRDQIDTISAAIAQRQAAEDVDGAQAYLDRFGELLPKKIRADFAEDLSKAKLVTQAQTYAKAIMQDPEQSKEKAYQQLKMIDNPELQEGTRINIEREFAQRAAVKREEQGKTYESLALEIEAGESLDSLAAKNPKAFKLLDTADRARLREVENNTTERRAPPEQSDRYYLLRRMASELPDEFLAHDFRKERGHLPENERGRLIELQSDMEARRNSKTGQAGKVARGLFTVSDVARNTLESIKIPTGTKDGVRDQRAIRFERLFDKAILAHGGVDELDSVKMQKIADDLVIEQDVHAPDGGWLWFDSTEKVRNFELPNADRLAFTIDQVPSADRERARAALVKRGVADPKPDQILNTYNRAISAQAPQ